VVAVACGRQHRSHVTAFTRHLGKKVVLTLQ
jgi:hypothetical protein